MESKEAKKKTVGQLSSELLLKTPESDNAIELTDSMLEKYEAELQEAAERGKKIIQDKDFYLVVITKKEPLMQNVLRHYFLFRRSCPTPDYDNTVYIYHQESGDIEFLWTVPDKQTCNLMFDNKHQVDKSEWPLLEFVLKFMDGSLDILAKQLNGEKIGSKIVNELE